MSPSTYGGGVTAPGGLPFIVEGAQANTAMPERSIGRNDRPSSRPSTMYRPVSAPRRDAIDGC
jgi:hypothetical protein